MEAIHYIITEETKNIKTVGIDPDFTYIKDGFIKAGVTERIRIVDITEATDDPGNTEVFIIFIPFDKSDAEDDEHYPVQPTEEERKAFQTKLEEEIFTSDGDHHEEVIVTTQNNEWLIILNLNK